MEVLALSDPPILAAADEDAAAGALVELLRALKALDYHFTAPTPATHARVLAHPGKGRARTLRDVFGWSLPFDTALMPRDLLALMEAGGVIEDGPGGLRSTVRVSSLQGLLLMHSAYPTEDEDSVFFGPDSYRFADFIHREIPLCGPVARLVDIGAGAGAGALAAALLLPDAERALTDVNPRALALARVNAEAAGLPVVTVETDEVGAAPKPFQLAMANPPYIIDPGARDYRDGGAMHGGEISLRMAEAALEHLEPGGRLLLYTGSAIVDGEDELKAALEQLAADRGFSLRYAEIDPDVFGEELEHRRYADVERIAVVGAVMVKG